MSQKTLNLCLERYNFVKFGETTKSSHTVLCINNAYSVNSDKYRLTPAAIASKHGEGYVFTLNYDFDRPLFTIVQKSYTLDGTSGNIVFEGIDPISKGGSKYLRKVTVSPVKLSDSSYLLEVTNDEYLRIGTTGAALGDEDLESLNEKIVATGGIEKSVETVGGKQVLKLDASGSAGAKEIVYFEVDPSDPPSGIYEAIGEALSNNKLPAIRSEGNLYQYTFTAQDHYKFVGVFSTSDVGYETFMVWNDDTVDTGKLESSLGYTVLPADGTEEHPAWAKVCELDLENLSGYTSYGLALLFTSDHINQEDEPSESGIFVFDVGSNQSSNSNSCNASWIAYTKGAPYQKILGVKIIAKYGIPSNPAYAPYPFYKAEVWVKYYGSSNIMVNALQNMDYNSFYPVWQGSYKFPDNHKAVPQSTEPSYSDTEEYTYRYHFYPAESPNVAYTHAQTLTSEQKAKGRENIGAASASDVIALQSQVSSLSDVSAYTVKGEATVAQLNAGPSGIQAGWAYQLTDSGTLTDGTLAVVAGDTVAWDGTKWFPLVKSDYYATKTYAQNVAHSIAPEFDPTRTSENPYKAGESVTYTDGKTYTFTAPHYGAWTGTDVEELSAVTLKLGCFIVTNNPEYLFAITDNVGIFLFGIRKDCTVEWAKGVPDVVKKYIAAAIADKVDKIEGKGLIDSVFANGISVVSNEEYIFALTDSNGKLLLGFDNKGCLVLGHDNKVDEIEGKGLIDSVFAKGISVVSNEEYLFALTDANGKVLCSLDKSYTLNVLNKLKFSGGVVWTDSVVDELVDALKAHGYNGKGTGDWSDAESVQIPKPKCAIINFSGIVAMPVSKTQNLQARIEFWDCNGNYFRKNVVLNAQGRSSMAFPKKNLSLDLLVGDYDSDGFAVKFGDWVYQDSFHLKAYYTDFFRCVGAVCYDIADLIYKDRGVDADAAWKLAMRSSVYDPENHGLAFAFEDSSKVGIRYDSGARNHPLAFPCIVFLNGSFYGVYSWQIKKNRDNYNQDKNNVNHVHLDGYIDNAYFWGGTIDWTKFEIRNPKSLKDIDGNKYDGDNPKELSDIDARSSHVKGVIEDAAGALAAIDSAISTYGVDSNEFAEVFEHYFDVDNLIDYNILMDVTQNGDSFGNNWQWTTYDGVKWYVNPYDLDGSFGGAASGTAISASTKTHKSPVDGVPTSYIFKNASYLQRLKDRYASLRSRGIITPEKIKNMFDEWMTSVGLDYYKKEMSDDHWGGCPCNGQPVVSSKWQLVLVDGNPVMGTGRTYSAGTTYSIGDRCYEGYGKAMGFYQFEAVEQTTGESPIVSYGFKDNFYRLCNSIQTRIDDMDDIYGYNINN